MKKCTICGNKIKESKKKSNDGFSDVLDNEEMKRLLKLKKEETVCIECKFITMAIDLVTPYYLKEAEIV